MKSRNIVSTTILLALWLLALCQITQAVVPAPDGGYPGANTAEGQSALSSLTTGTYNTAVGILSLKSDTTGSYNTAVGAGALVFNTTSENTATGFGALLSNATGFNNTANGAFALFSNITGALNTANGVQALFSNTTGDDNTAIGVGALQFNTTSGGNTAIGEAALLNNTTGDDNTASGFQALFYNMTGMQNTAIGNYALFYNTTGSSNTALGYGAGGGVTTANNVICIGRNVVGNNVDNSCYIGNIFGATSSNGAGVFVNSNGRLGTTTSSRRFKEEIKPMEQASEALFSLKPVAFRYKQELDPDCIQQFGLVAEDVEKVNPDLVARDKDGKAYSVRYDQVNAMLLNEFLKAHRKVQEQEATINRLEKGMERVIARLEEQESQIQKVSAQLELNKPAPRTVLSNP